MVHGIDSRPEKQKLLSTLGGMKLERSSWDGHWLELGQNFSPRSTRFNSGDRNKGQKAHNSIYDNSGILANRVLGAGLMGGATSPARPWFRLGTHDPDLMKFAPVKIWLNEVTRLMLGVFQRSNTYRTLHMMYNQLGIFGTGCAILTDNFDKAIHMTPQVIGEFSLATNFLGEVDTLYREIDMMVIQVVTQFGYKNCSLAVRNLYDNGNLHVWVPVVHVMEPRANRDRNAKDAKNMPFKSCYFENGTADGDTEKGQFLSQSGFKHFRGLCPRWTVYSNDVYGESPGMEALGDGKQLQHEQVRKGTVIDYQTAPPLLVPTKLKGSALSRLPGGVSYYDTVNPQGAVRSMFEVNLNLNHLLEDIQDVRGRLRSAFYTDLFLMLANTDNRNMTATEVAERHEEKLLMLGPVLERLHNELLDPLIDMTFTRLLEMKDENGEPVVPPPPPELDGIELKVEFISMLAQAQRAIAVNSIDRYTTSLGIMAQVKPGVLDKFDADKWADVYADSLGIDPELIIPAEQVAMVRQDRAEQEQQMQQAAMAEQAAGTAQKLSNASLSESSALTEAVDQFSGLNKGS